MGQKTTLGALIDAQFKSTLTVDAISGLPIEITNDPDFDAKTFTVKADGVVGPAGYPLFKDTHLALEAISVELKYNGARKKATGTVTGVLVRDGVEISVTITLSKDTETLEGKLTKKSKPFGFATALGFLGLSGPASHLPVTPSNIDLVELKITIDFATPGIKIEGRNSKDDGATLIAQKAGDDGEASSAGAKQTWQAAMIIDRPRSWKAADLGKVFAPVDSFASFDAAFVAIASHDGMHMDGSLHGPLKKTHFPLHAGLNIGMAINAAAQKGSPLAKALHGTFGIKDLFLFASVGPALDQTEFAAVLADLKMSFPLKPKPVRFDLSDVTLSFNLAPKLQVNGTLDFPDPNKPKDTISVYGSVTVTPSSLVFDGDAEFKVQVAKGLELDEVSCHFGFENGQLSVGLGGKIEIDKSELDGALTMNVPSFTPLFFHTEVKNVDMRPLFKMIYDGREVPAPLRKAIVLRDVDLWECSNPDGCQMGRDGYKFGMHFHGDADLFGFRTIADIEVGKSGFSGGLSIAQPLTPATTKVPGFYVTSKEDASIGPHFRISTDSTPYLDASMAMRVFGFDAGGRVFLNDKGFQIGGSIKFLKRSMSASCGLTSTSKGFSGDITVTGDFRSNPVEIPLSSATKVIIRYVSAELSSRGYFTYDVDGTVKLGPIPHSKHVKGRITFDDIGHQLQNLGNEIRKDLSHVGKWT